MTELKLKLPDGFLDEEVRCGYTVTSDAKKQWAVCLDLLAEFDRVCTEHAISYFASGGTLLGAIRHNGYIPWDDDIDIIMSRDNYERLVDIAETEFMDPYFFQTEDTDIGFSRPFARLRNSNTTAIQTIEDSNFVPYNQGIFIDIFPFDNFPDDPKEQIEYKQKMISLRKKMSKFSKWSTRYKPNPNVKGIAKAKSTIKRLIAKILRWYMLRFHKHNPYYKKYVKTSTQYNNIETKEWAVPYFFKPDVNNSYEKSLFSEVERVPFEMLTVPVPKAYEKILTQGYGNWREFIIGTNAHGRTIYDVDRSYKYYLTPKK
ncbi:MAG: LicD family protein [Lachnospiraceae bacterium]|nr:LicD family protein [Lachnospiraceae bacterium]